MENKEQKEQIQKFIEKSGNRAFPVFVDNGEQWAASLGLTKLEYAVIHNMPPLKLDPDRTGPAFKYDSTLSELEKARINKTIEACRYALKAIEDMSNG